MMSFRKRKPAASIPAPAPRARMSRSVRGFAAAMVDRLIGPWRYDGGFTPSEISAHIDVIRARSRTMAKDSPHYKRWLNLIAVNVVGEGFRLKSTPNDGRPGQFKLDVEAAKFIEYHWWKFCHWRDENNRSYFDASGQKTEPGMDRMNVKALARDGEFFIHVLRTGTNPYGITFRVLRPDWCDHTLNVSDTGRGTLIHAGVEMEKGTRRPVQYWFRQTPTNPHAYGGQGQHLEPIPAREIIHCFIPEEEGQPRGIPWAHASLRKMKMLEEYDTAELTAARDEACSVRTYYAPKGDEDAISDLTDPDNSDVANALIADKEPSQSEILPIGWKQEIHTPQHPSRQVTQFKNSMLRDLAAGLNVEYSNFANDWASVSFSSVRIGTIGERDNWVVVQQDIIEQCKSIQYRLWLRSFLELSVSGSYPVSKYEKFAEHEFRGRRWMWVDPQRDMNAAQMARDNGWRTDTDITADLGGDYDDNLETISRERESRKKAGFPDPEPIEKVPIRTEDDEKDE